MGWDFDLLKSGKNFKRIDFDGEVLTLVPAKYEIDDSLAVQAWGDWEPYGTLTVNLGEEDLPEHYAYFNINMYRGPELLEVLENASIINGTQKTKKSGFVTYPLVRWNLEDL